jgi:hypothetical protein
MFTCAIRYLWDKFKDGLAGAWEELKICAIIILTLSGIAIIVYGVITGLSWLFKIEPVWIIVAMLLLFVLGNIINGIYGVIRDAIQHCKGDGND